MSENQEVKMSSTKIYPEFDDLQVSTKTVTIYTNMTFDLKALYECLPYVEVDNVPLSKKKKRPEIGKVYADQGSIISIRLLQNGECLYKGIVTRPEKLEISQLRKKRRDGTILPLDQQRLEELEKSNAANVLDFQNQVCIILSIGTREIKRDGEKIERKPANINIMTFHDNFKIVGLRNEKEAYLIVRILWNYIKNTNCYKMKDKKLPRFVVDWVMTNLDFQLGFTIDRKSLNRVMNDSQYSKMICSSTFEPTSHTNVKIRMYKTPPEGWKYTCLVFSDKNGIAKDGYPKYKATTIKTNTYQPIKNLSKCSKFHTLLVPRSSKVIMSGKYIDLLKEQYGYFIKIIEERRNEIEEKKKIQSSSFILNTEKKFVQL